MRVETLFGGETLQIQSAKGRVKRGTGQKAEGFLLAASNECGVLLGQPEAWHAFALHVHQPDKKGPLILTSGTGVS